MIPVRRGATVSDRKRQSDSTGEDVPNNANRRSSRQPQQLCNKEVTIPENADIFTYFLLSLNREKKQRELLRVARENQEIMERIIDQKPQYSVKDWEDDWDQNLTYIDHISAYPPNWWLNVGFRFIIRRLIRIIFPFTESRHRHPGTPINFTTAVTIETKPFTENREQRRTANESQTEKARQTIGRRN